MEDGFMKYWNKSKSRNIREDYEDEEELDEEEENFEEDEEEEPRQPIRREPKDSLTEQVNAIKETLYKKIDVCFMKYGLNGLKKIDEAIAESLSEYISGPRLKPKFGQRAEQSIKRERPQPVERIKEKAVEQQPRKRPEPDILETAAAMYEASSDADYNQAAVIPETELAALDEENKTRNNTTEPIQEKQEQSINPDIDLNAVGNMLG